MNNGKTCAFTQKMENWTFLVTFFVTKICFSSVNRDKNFKKRRGTVRYGADTPFCKLILAVPIFYLEINFFLKVKYSISTAYVFVCFLVFCNVFLDGTKGKFKILSPCKNSYLRL